jgi:hypothetical protein
MGQSDLRGDDTGVGIDISTQISLATPQTIFPTQHHSAEGARTAEGR